MVKYLVLDTEVYRDTTDPNAMGEIKVDGPFKGAIESNLEDSYGYYGHILGLYGSPRDLAVAMGNPLFESWKPELVEGEEILASDVFPEFPEGAVS